MNRQICRLTIAVLLMADHSAFAADTDVTPAQIEFFETKVRPLLVERCHKCHGSEKQEAGLRLDSQATILQGGDTGPAIVPGRPDESELIRAVRYDPDGYQMPPTGRLPEQDIETLTRWVEMGAPWPEENAAVAAVGDEFDMERRAQRWSFQPLTKPHVPSVVRGPSSVVASGDEGFSQRTTDDGPRTNEDWCCNPIDRFILAKLQENGVAPAPEADRNTLLRRASFDVLGLPPSPGQVAAFTSDRSPDAYDRRIDDLLASPHFGERWGRQWLDLVRYAEGRGHEFDYDVANAHQYRDYVIRALNDDVPYDQFVVEHVAGDLLVPGEQHGRQVRLLRNMLPDGESLPPSMQDQFGLMVAFLRRGDYPIRIHPLTGANESILGTGFWFLGEWVHSPVDIRQDEADRFANMLDVYSKTFLGLTVACARCHDHKFDPITTQDFYALQGYLQSTTYRQAHFETETHNENIAAKLASIRRATSYELVDLMRKTVMPTVESLDGYLLAAFDVVQAERKTSGKAGSQNSSRNAALVRPLALERKLDAKRLEKWVAHLRSAAADASDPFHLWARLCTGNIASIKEFPHAAIAILPPWSHSKLTDEPADLQTALIPNIDRSFSSINMWGDSPAIATFEVGDVVLSDDPRRPIKSLIETDCVRFDPSFETLRPSADAIPEPGALGSNMLFGRTIRTPTFEITSGHLYLELLGPVTAHVVVDSHYLIKGPLHGELIQQQDDEEGWRTVYHDVSRYKGHRAHVAIIGQPGKPFAVREVQELTHPLVRIPTERQLDVEIACLFSHHDGDSLNLKEVAEVYRRHFQIELDGDLEWCLDGGAGIFDGEVATANWVLRHPELFGLNDKSYLSRAREIAAPLIERSRHLASGIRHRSATAPAMADVSGENEHVFVRGNWRKPGEEVQRRFLEVFAGNEMLDHIDYPGHPTFTVFDDLDGTGYGVTGQGLVGVESSGRWQLARWMVNPDKTPILPRVIVNRIWQHYFGQGIVSTPDDFGHMGQEPSHPELLDWLASELVEHDWSLKHIHRLILTSAAYRMSSGSVVRGPSSVDASGGESPSQRTTDNGQRTLPTPAEVDPDNRLLSHQNVKRLEGEAIRDAILALSGRLDERMYGKSVPLHLSPFMEGRGRPEQSGPVDGAGRRSVYIAVRRNFPEPFFQAFDMPTPHTTVGRRNVSNVPAQALAMMNNPLVVEQAQRWGERLVREHTGTGRDTRIRYAYLASVSREPTEAEIAAAREFITSQAQDPGNETEEARIWGDLCHVLLNAKEFLFVR